ncbi:hypothetical protein QEM13_001938 [Pseudomonas putida]|nr:hypothetical protein [Pseudomonas putida]
MIVLLESVDGAMMRQKKIENKRKYRLVLIYLLDLFCLGKACDSSPNPLIFKHSLAIFRRWGEHAR